MGLGELLNFHMSAMEIIARLGLALVCGGAIGIERELRHKSAGLRTHMMVCLGACGFVLAALEVAASGQAGTQSVDPLRSLQGIIQGIGFLGAGAIIQSRGNIRGMTTAAGIWVAGGIGICCGAGLYGLAMLVTLCALIVLAFVTVFEHHYLDAPGERHHPTPLHAHDKAEGHPRRGGSPPPEGP